MRCKIRPSFPLALFGAILAVFIAMPRGVAEVPNKLGPSTLVIHGASYARSWGSPALPGFGQIINRGVGGDDTSDMLKRFTPDVVSVKPRAVLIWGLVNNITRAPADKRSAAKEQARSDYAAMLRLARAAGIEVIIATEIPWTEGQGYMEMLRNWAVRLRGKQSYATRVSADVAEVNVYLRDLARRENCRLLDFERVFASDDGTRKPEYVAADGSHISAAGYVALTAYASKELQRPR